MQRTKAVLIVSAAISLLLAVAVVLLFAWRWLSEEFGIHDWVLGPVLLGTLLVAELTDAIRKDLRERKARNR